MLQSQRPHIVIRPKQPLHWLALLGVLAIGVLTANHLYGVGAGVFAGAYIALSLTFLCDKIVFDGTRVRRRGPGAWVLQQLGKPREVTLDEIEAISSYAGKADGERLKFQTVILGLGINWAISSNEPTYEVFIKALFRAVNPHVLDPLSTELLLYWREPDPPFTLTNTAVQAARHMERWRHKAIRLSLDGLHEAANSYFKIAHEQAPEDAQITYDLGRFLRRRALARGVTTERGAADLQRAETYLRRAGRLARLQQNARLLERVGEAFYELHQPDLAQQYFDLAAKIDPVRPRANIGLANLALQKAQGARAVHAYHQAVRGARATGAIGLAQLAARKSEYYERLMSDDAFLNAEAGWEAILTQLKWVQRGALVTFLGFWMLQLSSFELAVTIRSVSREVSATALIVWVCALAASQIILALRRS